MPLKLHPPRKGRSPNWSARGTYLGTYVDRTLGTPRRAVAVQRLAALETAIERGEFETAADPGPTFAAAALAYLQAGRSKRYLGRLVAHFGELPTAAIGQAEIDAAAVALYPNVTPATRNTCVYTPMSAVLRHAGAPLALRRPKGARGSARTDYLEPDDAAAIIAAADAEDPRFGLLLRFLLYTGCRLGEALALTWDRVVPQGEHATAYIPTSKTDDPRTIRLRPDLAAALAAHRSAPTDASGARGTGRGDDRRVWPWRQGGGLKERLKRAVWRACGLPAPPRWKPGSRRQLAPCRLAFVNFHTWCHTWATWMRRYGGADLQGLVATNRWRDPRSAARYAHTHAHEEWSRVDSLPAMPAPGRK